MLKYSGIGSLPGACKTWGEIILHWEWAITYFNICQDAMVYKNISYFCDL
jgi:hypothetical protein